MRKMFLLMFALVCGLTTMASEQVSIQNVALSVAEGEKIDEDGTFKVTCTYDGQILDDNLSMMSFMLAPCFTYDVVNVATGETVKSGIDADFDIESGSKNLYISGLELGTEYRLDLKRIYVIDYTTADWETNFGDVIFDQTESLPSVTFTTNQAPKVSIENVALSVAEGEKIDEDGTFKVTCTYDGQILDENLAWMSFMLAPCFTYDVVNVATGETVKSGIDADFDIESGSKNLYISGLELGTEYRLDLKRIYVIDYTTADWETNFGDVIFDQTENLPSVTFTTNQAPKVSIENVALSVAEGEKIDEDGTFKVTCTYDGQILDENLAWMSFMLAPCFTYDVVNVATGETVKSNIDADFDIESGSKNLYISGLELGTEYRLDLKRIYVIDYSTADWETNFGDVIFDQTENLPSVTFTTNQAPKVSIENVALKVATGEMIDDEDGTFKVTCTYDGRILDENLAMMSFMLAPCFTYDVVNVKTGEVVKSNIDADFDIEFGVKNLYVSDLDYETEYRLDLKRIYVIDYSTADWETNFGDIIFDQTENLPSVTFTTDEEMNALFRYDFTFDPTPASEDAQNVLKELSEFHITVGGARTVELSENTGCILTDQFQNELAECSLSLDGKVITVTLDHPITTQSLAVFSLALEGLILNGKPYKYLVYAIYYVSPDADENNGAKADKINAITFGGKAVNVYTVDGKLIKKNATADDLKALNGLYIIEGQKYMMK